MYSALAPHHIKNKLFQSASLLYFEIIELIFLYNTGKKCDMALLPCRNVFFYFYYTAHFTSRFILFSIYSPDPFSFSIALKSTHLVSQSKTWLNIPFTHSNFRRSISLFFLNFYFFDSFVQNAAVLASLDANRERFFESKGSDKDRSTAWILMRYFFTDHFETLLRRNFQFSCWGLWKQCDAQRF